MLRTGERESRVNARLLVSLHDASYLVQICRRAALEQFARADAVLAVDSLIDRCAHANLNF